MTQRMANTTPLAHPFRLLGKVVERLVRFGCAGLSEASGRSERGDGQPRTAHAGLAAALLLGVYLTFTNVLVHQGYSTVEFAKPALPSVTWEERVDGFANKLQAAFGLKPPKAQEFSGWILEAADRQRLDAELLASLVYVESSFRKNARSWVGAIGPTQIKPWYWAEFCGNGDLTDPRQNIHCGAQVLAYLGELCGGSECALATYNVGMNSTRRQAARRYVSKVDYHYLQLKTL